jgi:hypothetical protein
VTTKKPTKKPKGRPRDESRARKIVGHMLEGDNFQTAAKKSGYTKGYAASHIYATATYEWVKEEVAKRQRRALEKSGVHTDTLVGMLVEIASASPADVLTESDLLTQARARGVDHLIKKISIVPTKVGTTVRTLPDGTVEETPVIKEKIDLEMYNRLDAIAQLRDNFGMKQEPRVNTYEANKAHRVEEEIQKIMAADGVDHAEAARRLKAALAEDSPLIPVVNKYVN